MNKLAFVSFFAMALSCNAVYAVTYSHAETVRIGSKTIQSGDRVDKIDVTPDRKDDLINNFGVKKGEEWIFMRSGGHSATVIRVNNYGVVTEVLDMLGL